MICKEISLEKKSYQIIIGIVIILIILIKLIILFDWAATAVLGRVDPTVWTLGLKIWKWASILQIFHFLTIWHIYILTSSFSCTGFYHH